jgi:hypothetical protein
MFQLETQSQHVAYIIAEASGRFGPKVVIEPTAEAEEQWAQEILKTAMCVITQSSIDISNTVL